MTKETTEDPALKLCSFNMPISDDEVCILFDITRNQLRKMTNQKSFTNEDLYKLIICSDFDDYYADFLHNNPELLDELLNGYILFQELHSEGQNLDINKFSSFFRNCLIDYVCIHKAESFAKELFQVIVQAHRKLNRRWVNVKKRTTSSINSSAKLCITHIL